MRMTFSEKKDFVKTKTHTHTHTKKLRKRKNAEMLAKEENH